MSTSKAHDLPAGQAGERRGASARSRFLAAAIAGAVVAGVAGAFGPRDSPHCWAGMSPP